METNEHANESRMLGEVRRWRREAFEESRNLNVEERSRRTRDLCEKLSLKLPTATKVSNRSERKESA